MRAPHWRAINKSLSEENNLLKGRIGTLWSAHPRWWCNGKDTLWYIYMIKRLVIRLEMARISWNVLLSAHSLQCADSCKYLVSDGGDEGSRNETLAAMYKETVILQRRPAELNCVSVGQTQPDFFYLWKIMWGTDAALQNSQRGNPFGIWSQVSRLVSLQLNQTGKLPTCCTLVKVAARQRHAWEYSNSNWD